MTIAESKALALGRKIETDLLILDLHEVADFWTAFMADIQNVTLIDLHRLDRLGASLVKASYVLDRYGAQYRKLACELNLAPRLIEAESKYDHVGRGGRVRV
jgi:hypothetical protein